MQGRLFEIVYLLMDKPGVTAKELAGRFEVSQRTIYRDIDALSAAGIPVYTKKGKNGGIFLLEGFVLNKAVLTEQEKDEIWMGLQSLQATGMADGAIKKLGAFFQQAQSWVMVDFSGWSAQERQTFDTVKQAVLKREALCFTYYSADGKKEERCAEPLQLVFKSRAWYLFAFCTNRQDYRLFRMSRMRQVKLLGRKFERELPEAVPVADGQKEKGVTFTLRVKEQMRYRLLDEFEPEQVKRQEDGSFLVTATMPENEWLYGYLLSFGPNAQVVSPKHLRQGIQSRIAEMAKQYE